MTFYTITSPYSSKTVNVMQDKERLKKLFHFKETKETRQLNEIHNPSLDPNEEKITTIGLLR